MLLFHAFFLLNSLTFLEQMVKLSNKTSKRDKYCGRPVAAILRWKFGINISLYPELCINVAYVSFGKTSLIKNVCCLSILGGHVDEAALGFASKIN